MKQFRSGGALDADDLYVARPADIQLLTKLRTGGLFHVMSSSRTGKTSLALHALQALEIEEFRVAYVDISGAVVAAKALADKRRFYGELAERVRYELGLEEGYPCTDVTGWQRVLRDLRTLSAPVALVLDETNALLELDPEEREGFLASFKAFDAEGARAHESIVSVCLLGFVSPQALMAAPGLSTFNASGEILLDDFTLEELVRDFKPELLDRGLPNAEDMVRAIHEWTSGHPYMSARLAGLAAESTSSSEESASELIDRLAGEYFIQLEESREPVLGYAVTQLHRAGVKLALQRLELYDAVLRSPTGLDPEKLDQRIATDLQFAGLVTRRRAPALLVCRNRIMAIRFDRGWVMNARRALGRPFARAMERWLASDKRDDALLTLDELEEERAKGESWELSGQESDFLGRSVVRLAKAPRRLQRLASVAAVSAVLAIAVLVGVGVYARQATLDSDKAHAEVIVTRDEAAAIKAHYESEVAQNAVQQKDFVDQRQKLQHDIDVCLSADADVMARLKAAASKIQEQRDFEAATTIAIAADFVRSNRGEDLATNLDRARLVLLSLRSDLSRSETERAALGQARDACETSRSTCTDTLSVSQAAATACQSSLTGAQATATSCQAALIASQTKATNCQSSLTISQTAAANCQAATTACPGEVIACKTDRIAVCNACSAWTSGTKPVSCP